MSPTERRDVREQLGSTEEPRAYYNLKTDRIHVPLISTFHRAAGYYGTLAHELTHWTGRAAAGPFQPLQ